MKTMDCIGNVGKGGRFGGYKTRGDKILFRNGTCKELSVVTQGEVLTQVRMFAVEMYSYR